MLPLYPANLKPGTTELSGNSLLEVHPEIKQAKAMGLKIYRYQVFLCQQFKG